MRDCKTRKETIVSFLKKAMMVLPLFIFPTFLNLDVANSSSSFDKAREIEKHVKKFKNEKKSFPKGDLNNIDYIKKIIRYMHKIDQDIRKHFLKDPYDPKMIQLLKNMDQFHTKKMKEVLLVHGWITISKFTKELDHKAWLLVQHADHDPFFQAGCLFVLSHLIKKGETNKKNYAYLYDRVSTNFQHIGMKQKYGTQVNVSRNGEMTLSPYEGHLKEIDSLRKELGLDPIEKYLEKIKNSS